MPANDSKTVLVTGGAGYIGSHTVLCLQQAGYRVVVLDNLEHSSAGALHRVQKLSGQALRLVRGDVRDRALLDELFDEEDVDAVIHFAALKSAGDSLKNPLKYYDNNVIGTLRLVEAMSACGVRRLVFSSSAAIYGAASHMPVTEDSTAEPMTPYARTKWHGEQLLQDVQRQDTSWQITILRYFNPVGAHASGELGEAPQGPSDNIMPRIAQVAIGKLDSIDVFGDDYPTSDGSGLRDYIHVMDLAQGHLAALRQLSTGEPLLCNLGTGQGCTVLELIATFERVTGTRIACRVTGRRDGDIAVSFADVSRARQRLGWVAQHSIEDMCRDHFRWQVRNPNGYDAMHEDRSDKDAG